MSKQKHNIMDIVFLKTDPEKLPRIISRFTVSINTISYELMCGSNSSWHYDFEFTDDIETLAPKKQVGLGKS